MKVTPGPLEGLLVIEPAVHGDSRGFFLESFHEERYQEHGVPGPFVQDNHSRSGRGVLRGLHYQLHHPQGKLVRVSRGRVLDVAVDVRRGSPTFGRWYGVELDDESHRQLWIPAGFAHGFAVLSDVADFEYKCTEVYRPEDERGVLWSDPAIGIDWQLEEPSLSGRDQGLKPLAEVPKEDLPTYSVA